MRIAIVYNHDSQDVINLFGIPNKEQIGQNTLKRIANALRVGGHQVKVIAAIIMPLVFLWYEDNKACDMKTWPTMQLVKRFFEILEEHISQL